MAPLDVHIRMSAVPATTSAPPSNALAASTATNLGPPAQTQVPATFMRATSTEPTVLAP